MEINDVSRRVAIKMFFSGGVLSLTKLPAFAIRQLDTKAEAGFLSGSLHWEYPSKEVGNTIFHYSGVKLEISMDEKMLDPICVATLPEDVEVLKVALAPTTTYYWRINTLDKQGNVSGEQSEGTFTTSSPVIDPTQSDAVRYMNPRVGAHWVEISKDNGIVPFARLEPLSPWYSKKSYLGAPPPSFAQIEKTLPAPVLDSDSELVDLYWYCWKTFFNVWLFPPSAPDHQAVANLVGSKSWGAWGSTMVWDSAFILHFARYDHHAYPTITAFDNCYARQHENGFICRESDSQNRELYARFPLNPALFSWGEWDYFQISGDMERLKDVLVPIVKHYEWWMKYQRRPNGLYWTDGFNEADDSPRNDVMYYSVSASAYQALAALYISKIAHQVNREDLVTFFQAEHRSLGEVVRSRFWDEKHAIYNDLTKSSSFITELEPGVLCKHCHMFWPMMAEIADQKGIDGLIAELSNPRSFDLTSGVPSLSADSKGFRADGQYWHGSVWPPIQCMVQEGLRANGRWELAQKLAEKYLTAVLEAFRSEKSIAENLAPNSPTGHGAKDFVGWGGIGPISNLIEFILGFRVDAPKKRLEWRIQRLDRHGIKKLPVGEISASLICDTRKRAEDPCHITVESDGEFVLSITSGEKTQMYPIKRGMSEFQFR